MDLRLSKDDLKGMNYFNTMASEADFYTVHDNDSYLLKIYSSEDEIYLKEKSKKIDALRLFNEEEKISELVLPKAKIFIEDRFKGEVLKRIKGYNAHYYLGSNNVSLRRKIDALRKIGLILKK